MTAVVAQVMVRSSSDAEVTPLRMHPDPLPRLGRQRVQKGDDLRPQSTQLPQDGCRVLLVVLQERRQLVLIENAQSRPVVVRNFGIALYEEMVHIPKVAQDLEYRPRVRGRFPSERLVGDALEQRRHYLGKLREP